MSNETDLPDREPLVFKSERVDHSWNNLGIAIAAAVVVLLASYSGWLGAILDR